MGDRLASAFGLIGWFGVDYVLHDGVPWPVEVNPRYTASVEIHELAAGRPLLLEHRAACEGLMEPDGGLRHEGPRRSLVVAKWVVYAPRRLVMPEIDWNRESSDRPDAIPPVADIPAPGACIEPGEPVMTLLTSGADLGSCQASSRRLRREWALRLGFTDS